MDRMSISYYKNCKDSQKITSQNYQAYKPNYNSQSTKYSARTKTCKRSTPYT